MFHNGSFIIRKVMAILIIGVHNHPFVPAPPLLLFSVIGPLSPGFDHRIDPSGHWLDQADTDRLVDLAPFRLYTLPKLQHALRWTLILIELSLQMSPQMLNWVQIG